MSKIDEVYVGKNLIYSNFNNELLIKTIPFDSFTINWNGNQEDVVADSDGYYQKFFDETLTDCSNFFMKNGNFTGNNITHILKFPNTREVKSMKRMFGGLSSSSMAKIEYINLEDFNTSKCEDMSEMFYGCDKLTELDISKFNAEKCTNLEYMFCQCLKLSNLDFSNFYPAEKLTSVQHMFDFCNNMTEIDLSTFKRNNSATIYWFDNMINYCSKLEKLNIKNFNFSIAHGYTKAEWYVSSRNFTEITGPIYNFAIEFSAPLSPLTKDSAMVLINGAISTDRNYKMTFSSYTFNLLEEHEIATATEKGWTIIGS